MKLRSNLPLLALGVALALAGGAPSLSLAADSGGQVSELFGPAIEMAQKRTVKIFGAGIGRDPGYASGLIVSNDGLILTAQAVYLAGDRIRVSLPDGSLHMAQIVRRSAGLQAALLKIDAKTPDYFELSDKMPAHKGDWVLAVSNAFKVADGTEALSVNLGVLSLRTQLDAQNGVQDVPYDGDVVLIDAITSNPGAPGGALVGVDGRLVGMIGRIMESKATSTRLNFAVPVDLLQAFVLNKQPETSPMTTINPASAVKSETGIRLFALGTKRDPAYIDRVLPNSAAAKAGLKADDLVMSIAGEVIHDLGEFKSVVSKLPVDAEIEVVVKRKNDVLTVKLTPIKAE
ncbi:MAG TPA: S1C family serine protease [Pirellulaceae bacterium]|nr:S1C family serine protease [Pirellulaceae bacterium]